MSIHTNITLPFVQIYSTSLKKFLPENSHYIKIAAVALAIIGAVFAAYYAFKCYAGRKISKIREVGTSILVVNTNKITKSKDGKGEREHYSVSLISKENETIEMNQWPVDIKKHGEIKQILISDGETKKALKTDESIKRLIKYLSTDFETFRKEINQETVDHNGCFPNKYYDFDCQRFSYYLQHGKEKTYLPQFGLRAREDYKAELEKHVPGSFYFIRAETENYGKNDKYSADDLSIHHFMCLAKDVYVSKYGNTDVLFTSYKQILDAYFPEKFVKGNHDIEV